MMTNLNLLRCAYSPSHSVMSSLFVTHGLQPARFLFPWDSPGKNTGVSTNFLLQGIFPTQGLNPGLPHCRQILYHLSQQGNPTKSDQLALIPNLGFPGAKWLQICRRCRDSCSIPGSGRSPGEGNGNPLRYSCPENSLDRGTLQAIVCEVTKHQTRLSD